MIIGNFGQVDGSDLSESQSTPPSNPSLSSIQSQSDQIKPEFVIDKSEQQLSNFPNITNYSSDLSGFNVYQEMNISSSTLGQGSIFKIMDLSGNVLYSQEAFVTEGKAIPINSTSMILFSTQQPVLIWNYRTGLLTSTAILGHHDIAYNPITKSFITLQQFNGFGKDEVFLYDTIMEYDLDGRNLWPEPINTVEFISINLWNGVERISGMADVTHSNSLYWDIEDNAIYINVRNVNTFYKIDYITKEKVWGLGENGDFLLMDKYGKVKSSLFYHPHAVQKIDTNRFILFDNDYFNASKANNHESRVIEIQINEQKMTAKEVWSWNPGSEYYSQIWGDADRLYNGNTLVTFGAWDRMENNLGARIVEINPAGEIVWELNYLNTEDINFGVYQTERFYFHPLINTDPTMNSLPNEDINVEWDLYYNFKTNYKTSGTYEIYLDDIIIDNGTVEFKSMWRAKKLTYNFGNLDENIYNVTLKLIDEGGFFSTQQTIIDVASLHTTTSGNLEVESGISDAIFRWDIKTILNLSYEIRANSSLIQNGNLITNNVTVDLNSLELGLTILELKLSNETQIISEYMEEVIIYPNLKPEVTIGFDTNPQNFNSTNFLNVILSDESPDISSVYIEEILFKSLNWNLRDQNFSLKIPFLVAGLYNFSIISVDKLGNTASTFSILLVDEPIVPVVIPLFENNIVWNGDNNELVWQIYGGITVQLLRDGNTLSTGTINDNLFSYIISDWRRDGWILGYYNLTLQITDSNQNLNSYTSNLEVNLQQGTPYVNEVLTLYSAITADVSNIVGAPDNKYALIFEEYISGFITVDMGENEEIIKGKGSDFSIIATGGVYELSYSNSLDDEFIFFSRNQGSVSFDLDVDNIVSIRYLRITYFSGAEIKVDAIVALNHKTFGDTQPPLLSEIDFVNITKGIISVKIDWATAETNPYFYRIFLNSTLFSESFWEFNRIILDYVIPDPFIFVNITLEIEDIVGQTAKDDVLVQRIDLVDPNPKSNEGGITNIQFLIFSVLIITVFAILQLKNRKTN